MTNNSNTLITRITQHYAELTQGNRRLADYLQLNPEKILILSTNEIADACAVSKTSVSRFIRKLGYEDYAELRNELLLEREKGEPILTNAQENTALQKDIEIFQLLQKQLNSMDLAPLIKAIARAPRVKIIGYRNSYPLAMHFRQQLMQCRSHVELLPLPGQTIGEELAALEEGDFVIVIGIRRRMSHFSKMMSQLSSQQSLLITDQSGQKYASHSGYLLVCPMHSEQALDSYAGAMGLIAHLANSVYRFLEQKATQHSRQISINYSTLNELE